MISANEPPSCAFLLLYSQTQRATGRSPDDSDSRGCLVGTMDESGKLIAIIGDEVRRILTLKSREVWFFVLDSKQSCSRAAATGGGGGGVSAYRAVLSGEAAVLRCCRTMPSEDALIALPPP